MFAQEASTLDEERSATKGVISPFINDLDPRAEIATESERPLFAAVTVDAETAAIVSPFRAQYASGASEIPTSQSLLYDEVMTELFTPDFNQAIRRLVVDLRASNEARISYERPNGSSHSRAPERYLQMEIEQLAGAAEERLDLMLRESGHLAEDQLTEEHVDDFFTTFDGEHPILDGPKYDYFFKKLFKKVKKAVKKGVKIAKKVGKVVGKLSPFRLILNRLKKLVKPLLKRVLRWALNKIPARYRPLAKKLARKLKGKLLKETADPVLPDGLMFLQEQEDQIDALSQNPRLAAVPAEFLGVELDQLLAGFITQGEDFDNDSDLLQYVAEETFSGDDGDQLAVARDEFARRFADLDEGQDPTPITEDFVTAVLTGLRLGIKVIGRRRVVNFLAKQVAKIIRRFVGRRNARPLARALVDAGLKMATLEAREDERLEIGYLMAETIEKSIESLVSGLSDEVLDDSGLLEARMHEAFEGAAAEAFPPQVIRRSIRPRASGSGAWVMMPLGRRRKRYRKYTRPVPVVVHPGSAKVVRTFGGHTLAAVLREQMGLPIDDEATHATMHIYEVLRDTRIEDLALHETSLPDLGSTSPVAYEQFHPLTPEAAAALIPSDADLGAESSETFLADREVLEVGQRLYFLEIPEARVITRMPESEDEASVPVRLSTLNATLDYPGRRLVLNNFLSEVSAQKIAGHLRTRQPVPAIIAALRLSLDAALKTALSGAFGKNLHIIKASPSAESFSFDVAGALRLAGPQLAKPILRFVVNKLVMELTGRYDEFANEFVAAADTSADGVTLILELTDADDILRVLDGSTFERLAALSKILTNGVSGSLRVLVRPGYHDGRGASQ